MDLYLVLRRGKCHNGDELLLESILRLAKKLDPILNTSPVNILYKYNKNPTFNDDLRLESWDIVSMLGLANFEWDLGLHVNRPQERNDHTLWCAYKHDK